MMKGGPPSVAKGAMQADRGLRMNVLQKRLLGNGFDDDLINCIRFSPYFTILILQQK